MSCGLKTQEQRIATAVSNVRHCVLPWALQKVSPHIQRTETGKKYTFLGKIFTILFLVIWETFF